ncbi:Tyrosine-protein kinase [Aphelenchoides besseyi]|nr:Tyrosine-protein kinase [Aphelenchoides besseyi]
MAFQPPNEHVQRANRLEEQNWYHGVRSRDEIRSELKQPGDFIVRSTTQRGVVEIVLNVLGDNKELGNLTLATTGKTETQPWQRYYLNILRETPNRPEFNNVPDLITHYRLYPLPGGQRLKRGIPRPRWLLKHRAVQYSRNNKLGEGNFCEVFRGHIRDNVGSVISVAIKVCQRDEKADATAIEEARRSLMHEAKIMCRYKHENVIEFIGVACDHFPIVIVMAFCPGGSLEGHLTCRHADISSLELILYAFEVRKTVNCHWMAPETLSHNPLYSLNSDVWSYGVMCFEIFNQAQAPFHGNTDHRSISRAIRQLNMPVLPEKMPDVVKSIVREIWVRDPEQRPNFKQIVPRLLDHLCDHMSEFPAVEQLVVNKIDGKPRTEVLRSDTMATSKESVSDVSTRRRRSASRRPLRRSSRSTFSQTRSSTRGSSQADSTERRTHSSEDH